MHTKNPQIRQKSKNKNFSENAHSNPEPLVKTSLFGVGVTNASKEKVLEYLIKSIQNTRENYYIVTPNPEILVYATTHADFKTILNNAKLALCDGVGLILAGSLLGKPFKERFTGVDFVEEVCEKVNDWPITVGFLGGGPGVAEKTAECLKTRFPKLNVVFAEAEWSDKIEWSSVAGQPHIHPQGDPEYGASRSRATPVSDQMFSAISHMPTYIDVLFVAFGFPKQEIWMAEHINKVPVRVMVGVGGAFDYISGRVSRAPRLVQSTGFEWLFRLAHEPWRIKRQIKLLDFIKMVIKEKLLS